MAEVDVTEIKERRQELIAKLVVLVKRHGEPSPETWQKMFNGYDENRDLQINNVELMAMLEDADVGNWFTRTSWVTGIFEHLDRNENGTIDLGELMVAVKNAEPDFSKQSAMKAPPSDNTLAWIAGLGLGLWVLSKGGR